MIIPLLVMLITIVFAQISLQPIITSSACLNDCLQKGSLVFAASNLRNFRKIVLSIEEFCDTHERLIKCVESCKEKQDLTHRTVLSEHICKDKLEEFRLVKECLEGQNKDYVNQCASDCGYPFSATIQLDSSPAASINPFSFSDNITPFCRTIECIMRCSITESNKICAGSGDLFKDIGFKQVMEANKRLHADIINSSSITAQQLSKSYVEVLLEQCSYIIDPVKYDTVFGKDGRSNNFNSAVTLNVEKKSTNPSNATAGMETKVPNNKNNNGITIPKSDEQSEKKSTETQSRTATYTVSMTRERKTEQMVTTDVVPELVNEPDTPLGPPAPDDAVPVTELVSEPTQPEIPVKIQIQPVLLHTDIEHITEHDERALPSVDDALDSEQRTITSEYHEEEYEVHEHGEEHKPAPFSSTTMIIIHKLNENRKETVVNTNYVESHHLSTSMITQEGTERMIEIVNEDNEIITHVFAPQGHEVQEEQVDLKNSGPCERITLLLPPVLVMLPFSFLNL